MPTTAAQASVTTGTAIRTMLQIATPSTRMIQFISWGYSIDDPPGADAVFELIQTDVAATVTAGVAGVRRGVDLLDVGGVSVGDELRVPVDARRAAPRRHLEVPAGARDDADHGGGHANLDRMG